MSEPTYPPPPPSPPSPPPPPYNPPPGGGAPMGGPPASQQVQAPAMGILVVSVLGILGTIASILWTLISGGAAMADLGGTSDATARYIQMMSGGVGMVLNIISLALYAFGVWAALQMRQLRNWNLAVAASVIIMLPCSCCCLIGLPVGIWALIVLMKPEVKSAFTA